MAIDSTTLQSAINIINNVGQVGPLDATIDSYKQAADYADDARRYAEIAAGSVSDFTDQVAAVAAIQAQLVLLQNQATNTTEMADNVFDSFTTLSVDAVTGTSSSAVYDRTSNVLRLTVQKGVDGDDGTDGVNGINGTDGTDGTDGEDGRGIDITEVGTYIMWKYSDGTDWNVMINKADLKGADGRDGTNGVDGRQIQFRVSGDFIQWTYVGETEWNNLVAVSSLSVKGDKGDKGDPGDDGINGTNGTNGKSAYQIAFDDGLFSGTEQEWIASLKGADGIKGDTGPAGPPNTLSIGVVNTLAPGSNATVIISGTSPNQQLGFGIPAGQTGNTGATGAAGPANNLTIGTVTTLAAGSNATVSLSGTSPNQVFDIGIPRGANGANPVLTIGTVTTLPVGSSASATITGTSPNFTLNLSIPIGATGATGSTGATGPANTLSIGTVTTGAAGSNASATITGTAPTQTLNLTIPRGTSLNSEVITGTVTTAGTAVPLTFTKTYTAAPAVIPIPTWTGQQMIIGSASSITTTGCSVTVMQSRGTLVLTTGPFESAAATRTFQMLVIGS